MIGARTTAAGRAMHWHSTASCHRMTAPHVCPHDDHMSVTDHVSACDRPGKSTQLLLHTIMQAWPPNVTWPCQLRSSIPLSTARSGQVTGRVPSAIIRTMTTATCHQSSLTGAGCTTSSCGPPSVAKAERCLPVLNQLHYLAITASFKPRKAIVLAPHSQAGSPTHYSGS